MTSTENETVDRLLESTHLANTETFQSDPTSALYKCVESVEDVVKEKIKETDFTLNNPYEYTLDITTTKNLVPLEPDFTEEEMHQPGITQTTDCTLLQDQNPLDADQIDKNLQQTGITNVETETTNLPSKESKYVVDENTISRSKNISLDDHSSGGNEKQTVKSPKQGIIIKYNIKPLKVVIQKMSKEQIEEATKSKRIKKECTQP